jgi:hypothetical protein
MVDTIVLATGDGQEMDLLVLTLTNAVTISTSVTKMPTAQMPLEVTTVHAALVTLVPVLSAKI